MCSALAEQYLMLCGFDKKNISYGDDGELTKVTEMMMMGLTIVTRMMVAMSFVILMSIIVIIGMIMSHPFFQL